MPINSLVVFTLLLGFASPGLAQELSKRGSRDRRELGLDRALIAKGDIYEAA